MEEPISRERLANLAEQVGNYACTYAAMLDYTPENLKENPNMFRDCVKLLTRNEAALARLPGGEDEVREIQRFKLLTYDVIPANCNLATGTIDRHNKRLLKEIVTILYSVGDDLRSYYMLGIPCRMRKSMAVPV